VNILRRWIRFLFGFSKRETNGFLILIPLIMLALFSQPLYKVLSRPRLKDFSKESVKLDSMVAVLEANQRLNIDTVRVQHLFAFNPNTVTIDQLKSLGFEKEIIKRMINYREKGGKFHIKSDVLKIYGMDSSSYEKLYPFIGLPVEKNSAKVVSQFKPTQSKIDSLFDLNSVDSARLLKIYGIGPVLSSRIIRYREKLGGFIHQDQLFEVYGLDSVVVDRISQKSYIQKDFTPRKIQLNDSNTEMALSAHPYLSKSEAKAIVTYRFQHGPFSSVEDIRKIHSIGEKTFLKIEPYISIK
jgi:competence protein ComEA